MGEYLCVKLYFIEGLTYRELAEKLKLSVERVRQLTKNSLHKLKGYFNDVV